MRWSDYFSLCKQYYCRKCQMIVKLFIYMKYRAMVFLQTVGNSPIIRHEIVIELFQLSVVGELFFCIFRTLEGEVTFLYCFGDLYTNVFFIFGGFINFSLSPGKPEYQKHNVFGWGK